MNESTHVRLLQNPSACLPSISGPIIMLLLHKNNIGFLISM